MLIYGVAAVERPVSSGCARSQLGFSSFGTGSSVHTPLSTDKQRWIYLNVPGEAAVAVVDKRKRKSNKKRKTLIEEQDSHVVERYITCTPTYMTTKVCKKCTLQ